RLLVYCRLHPELQAGQTPSSGAWNTSSSTSRDLAFVDCGDSKPRDRSRSRLPAVPARVVSTPEVR
ncbi:MAG TPA: hypothetical protein VFK65_24120, partial [Candidatus Binatia bacterium]|nr:hypothetical protein [Candidatus Binatia bacterium]